jgi:hypothetical protein
MDVFKKAAKVNPLGPLFVGFAIGTIVGVIVPVSRLDLAKRTADDVMERGRSIVNDTLAAASESATKHGQALAADIEQEFRTIASST